MKTSENNESSLSRARIDIPKDKIAEFCRRHHIRKLALFGSVLREDFRPGSDVDVLVEFQKDSPIGLIRFVRVKHQKIPWEDVVWMRNKLIHGYDRVDLDILWDTVTDDLPQLIREIEKTLPSESGDGSTSC